MSCEIFLALEGYKFHFDGLFPFLNGSLTSSESNITSHYEGNQSSENILEDKPVITDDAFLPTINNEMSASGEKKQIVSVEADSTQKQALFVLQKLKIIEDDVRPGELCTRREYARWLVKANALLERNARHKIVLPELTGSSFLAAFDDVNADDPDFPFIQALAEVGIVPSKLLVASKSHFSEENSSLNHGTCDFSPERYMLRKNLGFMDLDSVGTDATPALFMDLLAEDKSIVRTVFGNSRRLQPHKPVTKAQAVVALASGRMARAIQAELVRHEMEDSAQLAQMEDIRAFWEGKLDEEKARRRKIQEDYLAALSDLKEEKIALERDLADHVKERAALDCQRQLLVSLREEVEQLQGRLADERSNLLTQKEILEEESTELRRQQDAIAEAKSILEVEKEALRILRCWVEEEANKNQMRAKVLEAAAQRWKWNGQLNVPRASPTDSRDECQK
ncbi:unnamed protein product [Spirodela intermedia]|uniref:Uncharacterized protein n=1 Tax=Spirodela intermedia TaxID=51605 RepID=A0A7I8JNR1_SPIIN|nr:unnamed protein product [Spirodela intermedia]CAA6671415.1 unnamed protein product [Spirodela intermedia]